MTQMVESSQSKRHAAAAGRAGNSSAGVNFLMIQVQNARRK